MSLRKLVFNKKNRAYTTFDSTFHTGVSNVGSMAFSPNGVYMYVNWHSGYTVRQYTLSTPWNIATATLTRSASISVTQSTGVFISLNGTKFYIASKQTNNIRAYNLTVPYDISTMVSVVDFTVPGNLYDIKMSSDGMRMFTSHVTSIRQYNLSIPWDISTAVFFTSRTVATGGTGAFCFSSDGRTILTVASPNQKEIFRYILSDAYEISSMILKNSKVLSEPPAANNTGIALSADGLKLYYSGYLINPSMYQYSNTIPNVIG